MLYDSGVSACTDVTGFGLLGHAHNIAKASSVTLEISYSAVPKFDGIEELTAQIKKDCAQSKKILAKESLDHEST